MVRSERLPLVLLVFVCHGCAERRETSFLDLSAARLLSGKSVTIDGLGKEDVWHGGALVLPFEGVGSVRLLWDDGSDSPYGESQTCLRRPRR